MTGHADYIVNKAVPGSATHPNLRSGEQFKESLRDGRHVVVDGRDVEDVTEEPTLRRGIDTLAAMFDAQHDPKYADVVTSTDPDTGERIATGWLVPRTRGDLRRHVAMAKFSTFPDLRRVRPPARLRPGQGHRLPRLRAHHQAGRTRGPREDHAVLRLGQRTTLISGDIIIDVQATGSSPCPSRAGRLRVVEERSDGGRGLGAKAGNTVMAQGNIGTLSMPPPNPTKPEECIAVVGPCRPTRPGSP